MTPFRYSFYGFTILVAFARGNQADGVKALCTLAVSLCAMILPAWLW